jgi:hypothetical protein
MNFQMQHRQVVAVYSAGFSLLCWPARFSCALAARCFVAVLALGSAVQLRGAGRRLDNALPLSQISTAFSPPEGVSVEVPAARAVFSACGFFLSTDRAFLLGCAALF